MTRSLLSKSKESCASKVFMLIEEFSVISGLTLNKDKTEILCSGHGDLCKSLKVEWVKEKVTLLGITIGKNMDKNWDNKLEKVQNCLNIWMLTGGKTTM